MPDVEIDFSVIHSNPVASRQSFYSLIVISSGELLFLYIIVLYSHVIVGNPDSSVQCPGEVGDVITGKLAFSGLYAGDCFRFIIKATQSVALGTYPYLILFRIGK